MDLPLKLAGLVGTALEYREQPFLVALCGWSDTGKSTMAARLRAALAARGIASESISTDDFMRNRAERHALGISGYDPRSLDVLSLREAIGSFLRREAFSVHPYDNRTGTKAIEPKTVSPSQVLVVEGIHSLQPGIAEHMNLKVFIDSDEATLRQMRYRGNMQKRGMTPDDAAARIAGEWKDYIAFVRPGIEVADLVVQVDAEFNCQSGKSAT